MASPVPASASDLMTHDLHLANAEARLTHSIAKTDADVLKGTCDLTAFNAAGFNKVDADVLKTGNDLTAFTAAAFNKVDADVLKSSCDQNAFNAAGFNKVGTDQLKSTSDLLAFNAAGFSKVDADVLKGNCEQNALNAAGFNKVGVDTLTSQYDQTNALVANADRAAIAAEMRANRTADNLLASINANGMNGVQTTERGTLGTATLFGAAGAQAERIAAQNLTAQAAQYAALGVQAERINASSGATAERMAGSSSAQAERIAAQMLNSTATQYAALGVQNERIAGASALQQSTLYGNASVQAERIGSASLAASERIGAASSLQAERIAGAASVQVERIGGATSAQAERIGAASSLQAERIGSALGQAISSATLANAQAHALTQREAAVNFVALQLDGLRNTKSIEEKVVSTTDSVKDLIRVNEEERLRDRIRALELVALAETRGCHDHCGGHHEHHGVPWVGVQGAYNFPGVSPTQFDGNLRTPVRPRSRSRSRG